MGIDSSGSRAVLSGSKRRIRNCTFAVCFLQLASALSAAEPSLVKLAVSEGRDIRFAHLTNKDGLSPGQIRDILQDNPRTPCITCIRTRLRRCRCLYILRTYAPALGFHMYGPGEGRRVGIGLR